MGPAFMKNDGPNGAKLGDHTHDYPSVDHKIAVEGTFRCHGFERIYSEPLAVDWDHPFPAECAESFFEVWKKERPQGAFR